ncbi:MAG: shikimate dehydrogenase [Muribaculaceae bacterium]|nr:shikimate dehydrogenase [Muribaculaceae bacterium]
METYGIIGKKLGHSFSAVYFNKKFEREGRDAKYNLFPLEDISQFPSLIEQQPDLKGLNVTIPYKQDVIKYLDKLSEEAGEIGAVNVVKIFRKDQGTSNFEKNPDSLIKDDYYLMGFNTDARGFRASLLPLLHDGIKSALVLGTGGASKAVKYILENLGIKVTLVSRNPKEGVISYSDITPEIMNQNLLIVNTTPLGMYPDVDSYAPIPYDLLTDRHICYDVVYNPETTAFMKKAAANGATVKNGLEMLEGQAIAAWDIWENHAL